MPEVSPELAAEEEGEAGAEPFWGESKCLGFLISGFFGGF